MPNTRTINAEGHTIMLPYTYRDGYTIIGSDLGFSQTDREQQRGFNGVKIELLSDVDESAIILPPKEVQRFAKWLLKTSGVQELKGGGANALKREDDRALLKSKEQSGRRKRNGF